MSNLFERLPPAAKQDFSQFGEIEKRPLGKIQAITAGFLHRNWLAIPHVTHNDELDITVLEDRRKQWNAANPDRKITPLLPLIAASVATLKKHEKFNASLDENGVDVVYKRYFNIGVAVDTPNGLLVPVLRECDAKPMTQLGEEIARLSEKARTKGLSLAEMSGGCFTISSLGHIGGVSFSPIINAPEVAILGVTRLQERPVRAKDGGVEWRSMLPVSLSYDHRLINGADAARFVVTLGEELRALDF